MGVKDMTVAKSCRLFLALTGSTELANSEGTYKFHSLTVADGGEVLSTSDVRNNSLTLDVDDVTIQGGGVLHMVRMRVFAGNFTVDDLGHVRGDTFDNRFVELGASLFSSRICRTSGVSPIHIFQGLMFHKGFRMSICYGGLFVI